MNKIIEIKEIYDYKRNPDCWGGYDGYKIKTEQDEYLFLIDNGQNCCENWGYLSTPDELSGYIGADLLSVKRVTVNDCAKNENLKDMMEYEYHPADTMFVNVETSNGLLQFAAYNQHNGYYGHDVILLKNGEVIEADCL
jgi:hypothetical protein